MFLFSWIPKGHSFPCPEITPTATEEAKMAGHRLARSWSYSHGTVGSTFSKTNENGREEEEKERRASRPEGWRATIPHSRTFYFPSAKSSPLQVCDACGQCHQSIKNHVYDYAEVVDEDFLCAMCHKPLIEPVETVCGHTFCYKCLFGRIRRSPYCPVENHPISRIDGDIQQTSFLVRKLLDKMKVICPNTAYCDSVMPRSELEPHLKRSCPGTYLVCPRRERGCMHLSPRCQLMEHLWSCMYGVDCNMKCESLSFSLSLSLSLFPAFLLSSFSLVCRQLHSIRVI